MQLKLGSGRDFGGKTRSFPEDWRNPQGACLAVTRRATIAPAKI
ncbi:hypothetical protein [Corynebacterium accolens]|nr:hypothetical protein [Corynebacterium accolens]